MKTRVLTPSPANPVRCWRESCRDEKEGLLIHPALTILFALLLSPKMKLSFEPLLPKLGCHFCDLRDPGTILLFRKQILKLSPGSLFLFPNGGSASSACGLVYLNEFSSDCEVLILSLVQWLFLCKVDFLAYCKLSTCRKGSIAI